MARRKLASDYAAELSEVVDAGDFEGSKRTVRNFLKAIRRGVVPEVDDARESMKVLQAKRQFESMEALSRAILPNVRDDQVRRRRAQALIELGDLTRALDELGDLVADPRTSAKEWAEAKGLTGRTWKQHYVDAVREGRTPDAGDLRAAIESYLLVYKTEPEKHYWHGVNVVSLLKRAQRDGLETPPGLDPEKLARDILETVEGKKQKDVWQLATAAEAYLALDKIDMARERISEYVRQKKADAFELSSTYRQFVQVLELDHDPRAEPILTMLRREILMRRGGAYVASALEDEAAEPLVEFLLRVARPDWNGEGIEGLTVLSRVGDIVACRGTATAIERLVEDPDVVGIEGSRPGGRADTAKSLSFVRVQDENGKRVDEHGERALIAVIDSGIDVLHEAFLDDEGKSRIVEIWDQTDAAGPSEGVPYGVVHSAADIAGYVASKSAPSSLTRDADHGTHVASIAAGRKCNGFAGGVAPAARILFVISKLEPEEGQPKSTGYSTSHVAALDYIARVADRVGMPVVVNLSQGKNAGAHDGTSLLEAAFDGFSEGGRKPGRIVVKSAGNERGENGHAQVTVGKGAVEDLKWSSSGKFRFADVVELWFASDELFSFVLRDPKGNATELLGFESGPVAGQFAGGARYHMTYQRYHDDNGDSRVLITISSGAELCIAEGTWTLEIQSATGGAIHAWVERYSTRALKFVNHQSEEMTLSIPGTAETVITVGAVESTQIKVGAFSSYGPTRDRRDKPDVAAPGVAISAAEAGTTAGTCSKDGTSMAAPHVSGAIALLQSRLLKMNQRAVNAAVARKMLRNTTSNYTGVWDRGQGFGLIDVRKLLS